MDETLRPLVAIAHYASSAALDADGMANSQAAKERFKENIRGMFTAMDLLLAEMDSDDMCQEFFVTLREKGFVYDPPERS